jgi:homocysteine S-methyltransferase
MTRASLRHLVDDDEGLLILDGGLGSAVTEIVPNLDKKLWSGGLVIDNPAAISAVHKKFLSAGADIITTASYQLSFDGLMESRGLGYNEALKVFQKSTYLAQNSVATFIASSIRGVSNGHGSKSRNVPLVASSVGCYGAYLADGMNMYNVYIYRYLNICMLKYAHTNIITKAASILESIIKA